MRPFAIPDSALRQQRQFSAAFDVLERGIREHAFPGAAFGVLYRGRVVALDGVGEFTYGVPEADGESGEELSTAAQAHEPVTPLTVYDLASVTKVVATTAAAMLLFDRGVLDLEEPLGEILPGFVIGMEAGSRKSYVTLRMLLAHSSGLPGYARLFETHTSPPQMLRACLRLPLEVPPGTRAEYSDIGFILLGAAIEVLSGQKLASLCAREIFEPLGMGSTRFCPQPNVAHEIPPTELDTTFRRRVIQGEVHDENCFALGGAAGHAGLFSSAGDVLRFAACILGGGRVPPHDPPLDSNGPPSPLHTRFSGLRLFHRDTVDLFATRADEPPGTSRALGWDTPTHPSSSGSLFSANSIGHLGYTGTSLWIDRERELAVVLLTNRTWPDRNRVGNSGEAIRSIRPLFHDAVFRAL